MFEKIDSSNKQKMNGCSFKQVLRQDLSSFRLNTGRGFFLEVLF